MQFRCTPVIALTILWAILQAAATPARTAAQDLRALQQMARQLEDAGYVERHGSRLQLTARGLRRSFGNRPVSFLVAQRIWPIVSLTIPS